MPDGSYVMRRPPALAPIFGLRDRRSDVSGLDAGPAVFAEPPPVERPLPPRRKLPSISVPAMSIAKNPPFQRTDPDKPLSCHSETSTTGRVRVVCL